MPAGLQPVNYGKYLFHMPLRNAIRGAVTVEVRMRGKHPQPCFVRII